MASSWKPFRWATTGLLPVILAFLVGWCSVSQLLARTPAGVHCPTARVQLVSVPVKDCCGHLVGTVSRKPRLGEKGFLQCRCAEKRTTQQQAQLDRSGPHLEMLPANLLVLTLPNRVPESPAERTLDARLVTVPSAPLVPPPARA